MKEFKENINSFPIKSSSDLSFYSAGIEHCKPNYKYGPRIRPYHVIHFVLSGKGSLKIHNNIINLKKGDIFIIPSDAPSVYQADSKEPWSYAWINFLGVYSNKYVNQLLSNLDEPFVIRHKQLDKYENLIREIVKRKENNLSSYFFATGILYQIISYIYEDLNLSKDTLNELTLSDEIRFYLDMNYFQPIKISNVAKAFNIHPNYLTFIFKEQFGITPKKYLDNIRYQKAKTLLTETKLSISEIAQSIGLEDALSFSKIFKSRYGVSPINYRKLN